ncbi:MAG TPA: fibronectin type III domain-containing protein [Thermoanaerobaculia bacterium]|nr:fibronectin type III domain-containing protein [Thermoanaerobaculia bacterium]
MSARSMAKAGLVLIGAWAFAAGPAVGQEHGRVKQIIPITAPELVQKLSSAKGGLQNVAPRACVANTIACGQTRTGTLTPDDCEIESDGSFFDAWFFNGTAGQTVTVNMSSTAVDSYLLLADPDTNVAVEDDNSGPGASDARLIFTLDATGEWAVIANSRNGGETGPYSVTLACSGGGGGGTAPAAPSNLTGNAVSSTEVALSWNDNSNNETGFRIESRIGNGTFVDIGTVSANSTGATVEQLSPNTTYGFRVRATNASGNSAYTNAVTVTTPQGGGGGGFITTPAFPDFRFRILINGNLARRENDCLPETLCVSGAVPGRSEVFVRIVGPRPNGFLWPNIIKFTTSRVDVEIQQISRGATKTYVLPGVDATSNDLIGFFDRTGFLP